MDEVSSYVRLVPAVRLTARPPKRLFRLVFESHDGRALGADSEEKHEPVSDIDTAVADSLKVLDLKRPIREADVRCANRNASFGPAGEVDAGALSLPPPLAHSCCYVDARSLARNRARGHNGGRPADTLE